MVINLSVLNIWLDQLWMGASVIYTFLSQEVQKSNFEFLLYMYMFIDLS